MFQGSDLLSMIRTMAANGELSISTLPDFASLQSREEIDLFERDVRLIRAAARRNRVKGSIDPNRSMSVILERVDFETGQRITVA